MQLAKIVYVFVNGLAGVGHARLRDGPHQLCGCLSSLEHVEAPGLCETLTCHGAETDEIQDVADTTNREMDLLEGERQKHRVGAADRIFGNIGRVVERQHPRERLGDALRRIQRERHPDVDVLGKESSVDAPLK